MGIFITTTTLLSKFDRTLAPYSGIFFSIIGTSICIWQGVINKHLTISDKATFYLLCFMGDFSSFFLMGGVFTAVTTLIAYSVYESVIAPEIYYQAEKTTASLSSNVLFSYILVVSNIGQAISSWISGGIVSHFNSHIALLFGMIVGASASCLCLMQTKNKRHNP
ncbi:hypothetical protein [Bartonella taylorii]|uniref:Uncharacterized protein n=1 Tax=Bartonella taylorii TaxID=33046 RepID=A0A9Q9DLV1_BARTA|nr:hypothetical protein [Bartonella taylorii]USP02123.1 hypothetical protein LAJ60_04270 [Bartonella taylorii]